MCELTVVRRQIIVVSKLAATEMARDTERPVSGRWLRARY